jgi:predicted transcriptional regulator
MDIQEGSAEQVEQNDTVAHTVDIVSSFVSNNTVPASELGGLIASVHAALSGLTAAPAASGTAAAEPVVSVRASLKQDHLVCLECGAKQKSLKRHLGSAHGLSPEEYRAKYNLPSSYPMVAPEYAAQRSALAKQIGLGRKKAEG